MKERTKSRLTLFARLWAVSVVLFIVFSIMYAYACMNESKNLIGLGAVGACIMFLVQVCQLVAAIMVRRWWCFAGTVIGIAVSLFVLVGCIVASAAGQYRPSVTEEAIEEVCDTIEAETETEDEYDFSFPVSFEGEEPTIVDFVTTLSMHEDMGEALGWMWKNWELYQQGKPLLEKITYDVDKKNSYFRYDVVGPETPDFVRSSYIEFRCWDFADGKHKLLVHSTADFDNGEPIEGQFSGLSYYIYDSETRRMEFEYPSRLNANLETMPEDTNHIIYKLPRKGNTIECKCYTTSGRKVIIYLKWNGSQFEESPA